MSVFAVASVFRVRIRLTEVQWKHITERHPEMAGQAGAIAATIASPDVVFEVPDRMNYHYYRRYDTSPVTHDKFLCAVVRHRNGEGFVITAYFTSSINPKGKAKTYAKKVPHQL